MINSIVAMFFVYNIVAMFFCFEAKLFTEVAMCTKKLPLNDIGYVRLLFAGW